MQDIHIDSVGEFPAGEYGTVEVDGVAKCAGPIAAQSFTVDGVCNCLDSVRADSISVDGALNCAGRLDAGEMEVDGAAKLKSDAGIERLSVDGALTIEGALLESTQIECDGAITVEGQVAAERVEVDGVLRVKGQLSADTVQVDGVVHAGEIVGDHVEIHSVSVGGSVLSFLSDLSRHIPVQAGRAGAPSRAGLIEATTISLTGVSARVVNGTDITIGPCCVIDALDCNGTLRLDPTAVVKNITGEYTMQ